MTNAELIKALRYCISDNAGDCDLCPYQIDCKSNGTGKDKMIRDAADALEAAEKKIEQLEKQVSAYQKLANRCDKQMSKMERENDELQDKLREKVIMLQRTKEGYVDG